MYFGSYFSTYFAHIFWPNIDKVMVINELTRHGHEELDGVPVAVEGELGLGHGAVGGEGAWDHPVLLVRVHPYRAPGLLATKTGLEYTCTFFITHLASITSSMRLPEEDLTMSGACRGTLMMTPLPVPSHSRLHETCSAVMRTKEKPSLPVPAMGRTLLESETLKTKTLDKNLVCFCVCV